MNDDGDGKENDERWEKGVEREEVAQEEIDEEDN